VTVCIAAMARKGMLERTIFTVSDRMLTSFAQYQSPEPKLRSLTSSIWVMWSGDASFQAGIISQLDADVKARVEAHPDDWLEVEFVAYLYQKYYNKARKHLAEQSVLTPLFEDTAEFIAAQQAILPGLADRLADNLHAYRAPAMETIIVGEDRRGQHIFVCENVNSEGDVHCYDTMGFAAIGSGGFHASSQFMLAGHGPSKPLSDTLFLAYLAKKRAQAAPGVGDETDIFVCEARTGRPDLPGWFRPLNPVIWAPLEEAYNRLQRAEERAMERAERKLEAALQTLIAPSPPPGQASNPVTVTPGTGEVKLTGHEPSVGVAPANQPEPPEATGGLLLE
jgi:hypothetical protein